MINGHGDDIHSFSKPIGSNFSSNVFYGANLLGLQAHLCEKLDAINNYPEPEPYTLETELTGFHGLPGDTVCVTNGATEAIYLIAQAFRGAKSAILVPTFSEYADACRMHGHRVTSIYRIDELPGTADVVWICNPNNPTGTVFEKDTLVKLIDSHPQVYFVIDMAYSAFTRKDLLTVGEAVQYPNVILLHSMTKKYAIPGLRLGYITADSAVLKQVRVQRMPWSVNQLAIEAGHYILKCKVPFSISMDEYLDEAQRLRDMLIKTKIIEVWPTGTHYMLARLRVGNAAALKEFLANTYGILIRDASNFDGLGEDYFRVAAQTAKENIRLVECIKMWLKA